jgi:hypothetical protein
MALYFYWMIQLRLDICLEASTIYSTEGLQARKTPVGGTQQWKVKQQKSMHPYRVLLATRKKVEKATQTRIDVGNFC